MPRVGFGLWGFTDESVRPVVAEALAAGYRRFDTGDSYGNEAGLGRALRESGVPREDVFVTSKVYRAKGRDATLRAYEASTARVGMDVLDLYLVHWPMPDPELTLGAWSALRELLEDGRVRAVGVSNFYEADLRRLLAHSSLVPAVDQIELHPWCAQRRQRELNAELGIVTEAWGPLGRGRGLLEVPDLDRVARRHGRSRAQIVLRWHAQLGNAVNPKSTDPRRMRENLHIDDFALDADDLAALARLDEGRLVGPVAPPFPF
ncbi:aldo/keto reductase [Actinacidiphila sp. SB3-2]